MTNLGDFRNLSFFLIPALPRRSSFPSSEIPNSKSLIYLYQTILFITFKANLYSTLFRVIWDFRYIEFS